MGLQVIEKKKTQSLFKEDRISQTTSSGHMRPAVYILEFCFSSTTFRQIIFIFTAHLCLYFSVLSLENIRTRMVC